MTLIKGGSRRDGDGLKILPSRAADDFVKHFARQGIHRCDCFSCGVAVVVVAGGVAVGVAVVVVVGLGNVVFAAPIVGSLRAQP